jgi:transposase-like protein
MSPKTKQAVDVDPELQVLAESLARQIKTQADLNDFSRMLKKMTIEAALGGEMEAHLGYAKHSPEGHHSGNSRNGYSSKTLKGDHGEVEIAIPRDRNGDFEPQLVRKGQTRLTQMDDQILALYAKGLTTREIVAFFKELYDADVSATLVSTVTEAVLERILEWQHRPLDPVYPIVYLDGLVIHVRENKRVIRKTVYLALGIDVSGHKVLLGIWIAQTEGAKFWLNVLTELQQRGVQDIFIACVDGLSGFPDAIRAVYPQTKVQLCIVHMVRNSLKYVSWKDYKAVTTDLKRIYQSVNETQAQHELDAFAQRWDTKYPKISQSWRNHWPDLITLFDYPSDIRKVIYTTNAIESLNSVIRKATKKRKLFPTDDSALKVIYLAIEAASKKWTMPIRNWKAAMNRFMIEFEDRIGQYV